MYINTIGYGTGLLTSAGLNRPLRDDISLSTTDEKLQDGTGNPAGGAMDKVHPLYGHGVCKWPGCEIICDDLQAFIK